MVPIRVDPDQLEGVAAVVKGAEELLQALEAAIRRGTGAVDWEAGPKADLEAMISSASAQCANLTTEAAAMQAELTERARAYRWADEQGQQQFVHLSRTSSPRALGAPFGGEPHAGHVPRRVPPVIPMQPFVPYHAQTHPAYADVKFGSSDTYAASGCTLTGLAMLVDYHRDGFEATRAQMEELAVRSVNEDGNVVWAQADGYLQERYGLRLHHQELPEGTEGLSTALTEAHQALAQGEPALVGVQGGQQHWVVIRGYTGEGALTDPAQFLIHDPYKPTRRTLADLLGDPGYQGGQLQAIVRLQEGA